MLTLSSSVAARIGQLVRLLGSDKSGEVMAATAAIRRTLAGAGGDLHGLADLIAAQTAQVVPAEAATPDISLIIKFCARRTELMPERDADFVESLDRQMRQRGARFRPSEKQTAWLLGVYERLRRR